MASLRLAQLSDRGNKVTFSSEWGPGNITTQYDFTIQGGLSFLVDTDTKGKGDIIRQYINAQPKTNGHKPRVIIIRPVTKNDYDQNEVDALLAMFMAPEYKFIQDLPYRSTKTRYSSGMKRDRSTKLVWDGFKTKETRWGSDENRNFSRLTWRPEVIDSAEGGLYVQIDRFTPMLRNGYTTFSNIDKFLAAARGLDLIDADIELVGLNEKEISQFRKASDEWYNVIDEVASEFDQANEDNVLFQALVLEAAQSNIGNRLGREFEHNVIDKWNIIGPMMEDCAFKDAIQTIVDLKAKAPRVETSSIRTVCNVLNISTDHIYEEANQLTLPLFVEYDKYALFSLFIWGRCTGEIRDHVIKYINSVDTSPVVADNDQRIAA